MIYVHSTLMVLFAFGFVFVVSRVISILRMKADEALLPGIGIWLDDSAPFTIVVDDDLLRSLNPAVQLIFLDAIERAVNFWDHNVPGLFVPYGETLPGKSIPVMPRAKLVEGFEGFGYTRLTQKGGRIWAAGIYFDAQQVGLMTSRQLWRSIAHEMGHAVGLAHDTRITSIMYATAIDARPIITDVDRALLRGLYA